MLMLLRLPPLWIGATVVAIIDEAAVNLVGPPNRQLLRRIVLKEN